MVSFFEGKLAKLAEVWSLSRVSNSHVTLQVRRLPERFIAHFTLDRF